MVFAGYFPGGPPFPCITKLFAELSLPWEAKEYYRTQFHLNTTVTQINTSNLSPRYSQKAVQLAKVQPSDAVYLALPTSRIQSTVVFPLNPVENLSLTPVAVRMAGQDKVGYVGDVNAGQETFQVILELCGLGA